jgi:thiamine transport system ATP-binding protein
MLQIDNVTFGYDSHTASTYRYDLRVAPGEVVGILGPSGSGKSTLLDLVAGFLDPSGGRIELDGTNLLPLSPGKRPVTILFQQHNLFEHLNVVQNVLIGLRGEIRGTPEETERAIAILDHMGIASYADTSVTELSGGQQQRVALARALLRQRPILLLDEPFTGLDDATRYDTLELVRTLTDNNRLHTIMVTHDRSDCEAIADSVYVMEKGELVQEAQ